MGNIDKFKVRIIEIAEMCAIKINNRNTTREMLLNEFTEKEIDTVIHMHSLGYGSEGFVPTQSFWENLYEWHSEWSEIELISDQPIPDPSMCVQRRGHKPTRAVHYYMPGSITIFPGDEEYGWLKTEDGLISCEGTYRVLGFT